MENEEKMPESIDPKNVDPNSDETRSAETRSVDEEWAETLKMNYDPSRLRQTPPPVPGAQERRQQTPYQPNPMGNYPGGGQPQYAGGNPAPQQQQPQRPMPSTYLIWSIVCTVLCCTIPGIVAIVFSSQVSSKYFMGDYEGAERASHTAQIWIIVSFVLGVLSSTLYLPLMMIG